MANGQWPMANRPVGTQVVLILESIRLVNHQNRMACLDLVMLDALVALLLLPVPCSETRLV